MPLFSVSDLDRGDMESLIIATILLVAAIWIIRQLRSSKRPGPARAPDESLKPTIEVSIVARSRSIPSNQDETIPGRNGGWILNPKTSFPLTIVGVDREGATELKRMLDKTLSGGYYEVSNAITPTIAQKNLRCLEIDEYISKFKPVYLAKIDELKGGSAEWKTATEKDRQDLLTGFRNQALAVLDIRPYADLEVLFELEPQDATIDDALIGRYGFDVMQLYFKYAGEMEKARTIPAEHRDRSGFEQLVQHGLAVRGTDISTSDQLLALKLQDLNKLVVEVGGNPVSRKAKAVEMLRDQPSIHERLGEVVAFRELFQLRPLPAEFAVLDLRRIADAWKYAAEVASLVAHTYMMAGYASQRDGDDRSASAIGGKWQVLPAQDACPYCRRAGTSIHPRRPDTPLHVGCRCTTVVDF